MVFNRKCSVSVRLYNSGVTEECDVNWMDVKSEFET